MFKEFGRKISESNNRQAENRQNEHLQKIHSAQELAYGLNSFLLENEASLEEMLKAAGEKAKVKVSNRPLGVVEYPAIKLFSETVQNETETILVGVFAPERHYEPKLVVGHHRYIRSAYRFDDSYYVSQYRPTASGIEIWPYSNGFQSDYKFINALMGFSKIPTIEKVRGDMIWQARKLSWKFK